MSVLRKLRTPAAAVAFVLAWAGVTTWLWRWTSPIPLPDRVRLALAAACAAWSLVWLVVGAAARRGGPDRPHWRATLSANLTRASIGLAPLALLLGVRFLRVAPELLLIASGVGFSVAAAKAPDQGDWGRSSNRALWPVAFLGGLSYLASAWHASAVLDFDGAYSFGMARELARGRWMEPIIWQYASGHLPLPHPPFDYWPPGTALVLLGPMLVAGATERVAVITIAAVSAVTLTAFVYLVTNVLQIRSWAARLAAISVFAFSPALAFFRSEPETIAVAQLWLVLALVAIGKKRYVLGTALACAMVFSRADSVIPFALFLIASVWYEMVDSRLAARRRVPLLLVVALLPFVAWTIRSHLAFGTWWPPGASASPFLPRYHDLFSWAPNIDRAAVLRLWFTWDNVYATLERTVDWIRRTQLLPYQGIWFLFLFAPGWARNQKRSRVEVLCWLTLLLGLPAQYFAAGVVGDKQRYVVLPQIAVLGAIGLDRTFTWLEGCRSPVKDRAGVIWRGVLAVLAGSVVALCLSKVRPYGPRPPGYAELSEALVRLDEDLGGGTVASDIPWIVFAKTGSPVIMIPGDGEQAIIDAFKQYHVRWMILNEPAPGWMGQSKPVLARLSTAARSRLGPLSIERHSVPGARPMVYRVSE